MLALWSGELVPQTDAQRKFIEATHDRVPTTTWEESVFRIFLQHAGVAKFRTHNAYLARQAGIVEAQLRDNDESALGVHRTLTDAQASREWGVDDALLDSGDVVRSDSAYQPELDAELDGDCAEPVSDRDSDAATFDDET